MDQHREEEEVQKDGKGRCKECNRRLPVSHRQLPTHSSFVLADPSPSVMIGMPFSNEGFSRTINENSRLHEMLESRAIHHGSVCTHCLETLTHMIEQQVEQEEQDLTVLREALRHASTSTSGGSGGGSAAAPHADAAAVGSEGADEATLRRREQVLDDSRATIAAMDQELQWLQDVGMEWFSEERALAARCTAWEAVDSKFREDLDTRLSRIEALLTTQPELQPNGTAGHWSITNDDRQLQVNGWVLPSPKDTSTLGAGNTGWGIAAVLVAQAQGLVPPSTSLARRVLPLGGYPRVIVAPTGDDQRDAILDFNSKGPALNTTITEFEAAVYETATALGKPMSPPTEGFRFFDQRWSKAVRSRLAEGLSFLAGRVEDEVTVPRVQGP